MVACSKLAGRPNATPLLRPGVGRSADADAPECALRHTILLESEFMAEHPVYPPSEDFVRHAHVKGMEGYRDFL